MSRLEPINREQAFAYALEDDAKLLHKFALIDDAKGYAEQMERMLMRIDSYQILSGRKVRGLNNIVTAMEDKIKNNESKT